MDKNTLAAEMTSEHECDSWLQDCHDKLVEALGEIFGVSSLNPPATLQAAHKRLAHIRDVARTAIAKAKGAMDDR